MAEMIESIGGYKVLEHLGSGSFADTYRVKGSTEEQYALKLLRSTADDEGRRRFPNEIWALKALDHVAIPKFIAEGIHGDRPFLVQSLARGSSLRKLVEKQRTEGGPCALMRVLQIAGIVLDALAHMHERGVLHRDVKDDNIIATPSVSHVSLADSGAR